MIIAVSSGDRPGRAASSSRPGWATRSASPSFSKSSWNTTRRVLESPQPLGVPDHHPLHLRLGQDGQHLLELLLVLDEDHPGLGVVERGRGSARARRSGRCRMVAPPAAMMPRGSTATPAGSLPGPPRVSWWPRPKAARLAATLRTFSAYSVQVTRCQIPSALWRMAMVSPLLAGLVEEQAGKALDAPHQRLLFR